MQASAAGSAAELMLSLLEASNALEENKDKTEQELFIENSESFFKIIGEQNEKKNFWWAFYADFYAAMIKAGHNEVFCNYITQSKKDEKVIEWLNANEDKVTAFSKWVSHYKHKVGKKK